MSLGSSLDVKERIRQATDIVELVGKFMQLKRQGRNFVGLCPWHDDSRPSLQINPDRQSWKCWVCDIGGDVFSFIMQMEGVEFPEALAMLAERAGIPLKPERPAASVPVQGGPAVDKRVLLRAMAWAEAQYHKCLVELPEGEPGRRYLARAPITPESIEQWKLGYSPDQWDWIIRQAEAVGANPRVLEAAGVLARSAGGDRLYDRFRGRVLFSIRDTQSRPVGLGGRVLPSPTANTTAKYVNSPETPLFSKSHLLYGLDVARDAIRHRKFVMVMEGYTDCIVAHQYGFTNAVAVLGTALGDEHLRLLKRFTDRVVLILDGDEAGQRRTNEVLELFVARQIDLRVLTLPTEKDPCDFLLKHGAEALEALLQDAAVDALQHAFRTATQGIDVERDTHAATQAMNRLIGIVARAPRQRDDTTPDWRLREEKLIQRIAAWFRVEEGVVRSQITEERRRARPSLGSTAAAGTGTSAAGGTGPQITALQLLEPWERELLEVLLQFPQCLAAARAAIAPEAFTAGAARDLFLACCRLEEAGVEPTFQRLMLEFDDAAVKSFLATLEERGSAKGSQVTDPAAVIRALIANYESTLAQRQRPAQAAAIREGQLDERQQLELLQKTIASQRARQGISKPMEGRGCIEPDDGQGRSAPQ